MAKDTESGLYVAKVSFHAESGLYREGEIVDPDDPVLAANPDLFRPFTFAHPVKKRTVAPPVEQATAAPGEKRGK